VPNQSVDRDRIPLHILITMRKEVEKIHGWTMDVAEGNRAVMFRKGGKAISSWIEHSRAAFGFINGFTRCEELMKRDGNDADRLPLFVISKTETYYFVYSRRAGVFDRIEHQSNPSYRLADAMKVIGDVCTERDFRVVITEK
jgi:hypothetical protein